MGDRPLPGMPPMARCFSRRLGLFVLMGLAVVASANFGCPVYGQGTDFYSDPIPLFPPPFTSESTFWELGVHDFNGDGLDDVIASSPRNFVYPPGVPEFEVRFYLNDGKGSFYDGTDELLAEPAPAWFSEVRQYFLEDFNGDGKADLFLSSTNFEIGTDPFLYPGGRNVLMLSGPDGRYYDASDNLPRVLVFSHGTSVGDFDGDGDLDIWDNGLSAHSSLLLVNDGSGEFQDETRSRAGHLSLGYRREGPVGNFWSQAVDADGDGTADLYLSQGQDFPDFLGREWFFDPQVALGGANAFSDYVPNALPPTWFGYRGQLVDLVPCPGCPAVHSGLTEASTVLDIDGDGLEDLVVTETGLAPNGNEDGTIIRLLISNGDGTFRDETWDRLPEQPLDGLPWYSFSRWPFADFNGDGAVDIVTAWNTVSKALINDGSGVFRHGPADFFLEDLADWCRPLDVDGDGGVDFFCVGNVFSEFVFYLSKAHRPLGPNLVGDDDADRFVGGRHADRFAGEGGADELLGGDADDLLLGGADDDLLAGEGGSDTLAGGPGIDTAHYWQPRHRFDVLGPDALAAMPAAIRDRWAEDLPEVSGWLRVVHRETGDTDYLVGVETLRFADGSCSVVDLSDADLDGTPDDCDVCPGFDDTADTDGDGVPNGCDLCPGFDDLADGDADGIADGCDPCLGDQASGDGDADGTCDDRDRCPGFDDRLDSDRDGAPDGCDVCPQWDPRSTSFYWGSDDTLDGDGDGVPAGCDLCDGADDLAAPDSDGDGRCDLLDNCEGIDDFGPDVDGDSNPDSCDSCPGHDYRDWDGDGVGYGCDGCPQRWQACLDFSVTNDGFGCPGSPVTLEVNGATPESTLALLWSPGLDPVKIPGDVCTGVDLRVSRLLTLWTTDANGSFSLTTDAPAPICNAYVQVLDVETCTVSEAPLVP